MVGPVPVFRRRRLRRVVIVALPRRVPARPHHTRHATPVGEGLPRAARTSSRVCSPVHDVVRHGFQRLDVDPYLGHFVEVAGPRPGVDIRPVPASTPARSPPRGRVRLRALPATGRRRYSRASRSFLACPAQRDVASAAALEQFRHPGPRLVRRLRVHDADGSVAGVDRDCEGASGRVRRATGGAPRA